MSAPSPGSPTQPRRSALKADGDSERTPPLSASVKAPVEESQAQQPPAHHRHRLDVLTERLLAQVGDWLEREKAKKEKKKSQGHSIRRRSPPNHVSIPVPVPGRQRSASIESDSSEVSLDRLQRILDDSMTTLGLNSTPSFGPRLGRKHRKRSSRNLSRVASSDTEWFEGDVLVPTCDAVLDNSKTLSYTGGKAGAEESPSGSSRKEEKEKQNWIVFKNEIIRLAHTLRLKGWRRVPLDSGESVSVERLSGALTNAVYVVSPPSPSLLPQEPGKKQPTKVLLRVYGPQVEHLIDRETELGVLRRLARKKIGPRLLGTFLNGRFEQYLNATALTPSSMREPETSKQIAKRMRELHQGVELLEEEKDQGPGVWKNWDKWLVQVEKTVLYLDKQLASKSRNLPGGVWKTRGLVCGVEWPVFKALVEKYRRHLEVYYGDAKEIRRKLVFAHNDTQYGNILRVRPDDQKSPLLQPANEHKQLVVIDFEYAGANTPGLEFANHFSEWTYNYHDAVRPFACDTSRYPTPDQQLRFLKAYVGHRPKFSHAEPSPAITPAGGAGPAHINQGIMQAQTQAQGGVGMHNTPSTSSIVEFMLDARVPAGGWKEEERKREEDAERMIKRLMEETRLWRVANSAQWVAWGIVQAKIPGLDTGTGAAGGQQQQQQQDEGAEGEEEFDYLSYAQERAYFFLGDCVLMGLVKAEELGEGVMGHLKMVNY
ncbi:hypothetical protein N0V88_003730 [Collariella sp. IMI 366227]|nr:hypothetical protein N0V88_003730 [Collariella sp. IMI 366227]